MKRADDHGDAFYSHLSPLVDQDASTPKDLCSGCELRFLCPIKTFLRSLLCFSLQFRALAAMTYARGPIQNVKWVRYDAGCRGIARRFCQRGRRAPASVWWRARASTRKSNGAAFRKDPDDRRRHRRFGSGFLFVGVTRRTGRHDRAVRKKMHALLVDGMDRARQEGGEFRDIIDRMTLLKGDAKELLPTLSGEAILIDPMHPPRKNSALVKRELRQVREIVGTDEDAADLVRVALEHALKRVVLKWPAKADPINGVRPCSHQILGKSTRYDVFMTG